MPGIARHSHYVPRMYLNAWGNDNKLWQYDLLVPNEKCPIWRHTSIENTASIDDLYTRMDSNDEYDDFEHYFEACFETPCVTALQHAIDGQRMTSDEWERLVDFIACQYVRTPYFYQYTREPLMKVCSDVIDGVGDKLKEAKKGDLKHQYRISENDKLIPISVTKETETPESHTATLYVETIAGKNLWLFSIKHLLADDSVLRKGLQKRRWSIMTCCEGIEWPSNDNPCMIINEGTSYSLDVDGKHRILPNFIVFPISPRKALISIGTTHHLDSRFSASKSFSEFIRKVIIKYAFRHVYAAHEDYSISSIYRRTVDLEMFRNDKAQVDNWYKEYMEKEAPLLTAKKRGL